MGITNRNPHFEVMLHTASTFFTSFHLVFHFDSERRVSIFRLSVIFKTLKTKLRASLVAQWLGVCLPMQGTRVRALVWEDPTCRGAIRPVSHNC